MMTNISKLGMYIASYECLYFSVIVERIYRCVIETDVLPKDICICCVCGVLLAFSAIYCKLFFKKENNMRIHNVAGSNIVWDAFSYLAINIITVILPACLSDSGVAVDIIIIIVFGIVFINGDKVYASPIFLLHRYKVYECNNYIVLTTMSREKFNIQVEETIDGVEARELTKGVYIVL
jgi:hypothetical protein